MILRIWRAPLDPARIEEYWCFERKRCVPTLHRQPGFLGVLFLRGAGELASSLTVWEDRGAVDALESSPSYGRAARELAESGLLAGEESVDIFEVVGGTLRLEPLDAALNRGEDHPAS